MIIQKYLFSRKAYYHMINNEAKLLQDAICYEEGHPRRTQHILKVYALAKLLGEQEKLSVEDQQILQAAAILHDIAIKYCKQHYNGDASQEKQQLEAPALVTYFLQEANYIPSYIPKIMELVINHHNYDILKDKTLQLLMEADLIINCYEDYPNPEKKEYIKSIFQTPLGKQLLEFCLKDM